MTSKGLSKFFCLHPPSLLTPIFLLPKSNSLKKKKKKNLHDTHTIIPFLGSIHLLIYFHLLLLLSWNYFLSGLLTTTSPEYPADNLGFAHSTSQQHYLPWNNLLSRVLGPILWPLWLLLHNVYWELSLLNQSSWGSRPLLFSRPGTGNYGPQGTSGLLPVFVTKFIRIDPILKTYHLWLLSHRSGQGWRGVWETTGFTKPKYSLSGSLKKKFADTQVYTFSLSAHFKSMLAFLKFMPLTSFLPLWARDSSIQLPI